MKSSLALERPVICLLWSLRKSLKHLHFSINSWFQQSSVPKSQFWRDIISNNPSAKAVIMNEKDKTWPPCNLTDWRIDSTSIHHGTFRRIGLSISEYHSLQLIQKGIIHISILTDHHETHHIMADQHYTSIDGRVRTRRHLEKCLGSIIRLKMH